MYLHLPTTTLQQNPTVRKLCWNTTSITNMTKRATHFTPEVLLSAPRRSSGVPNHDGSSILYSVSEYSFEEHKTTKQIKVLDADSNESKIVTDAEGASEPKWLVEKWDDGLVMMFTKGEHGKTNVLIGEANGFSRR